MALSPCTQWSNFNITLPAERQAAPMPTDMAAQNTSAYSVTILDYKVLPTNVLPASPECHTVIIGITPNDTVDWLYIPKATAYWKPYITTNKYKRLIVMVPMMRDVSDAPTRDVTFPRASDDNMVVPYKFLQTPIPKHKDFKLELFETKILENMTEENKSNLFKDAIQSWPSADKDALYMVLIGMIILASGDFVQLNAGSRTSGNWTYENAPMLIGNAKYDQREDTAQQLLSEIPNRSGLSSTNQDNTNAYGKIQAVKRLLSDQSLYSKYLNADPACKQYYLVALKAVVLRKGPVAVKIVNNLIS